MQCYVILSCTYWFRFYVTIETLKEDCCMCQEATEAVVILAVNPCVPMDESTDLFQYVERFVCLLYDPSTHQNTGNNHTHTLFSEKGKSMESPPPSQVFSNTFLFSQASLLQHVSNLPV